MDSNIQEQAKVQEASTEKNGLISELDMREFSQVKCLPGIKGGYGPDTLPPLSTTENPAASGSKPEGTDLSASPAIDGTMIKQKKNEEVEAENQKILDTVLDSLKGTGKLEFAFHALPRKLGFGPQHVDFLRDHGMKSAANLLSDYLRNQDYINGVRTAPYKDKQQSIKREFANKPKL